MCIVCMTLYPLHPSTPSTLYTLYIPSPYLWGLNLSISDQLLLPTMLVMLLDEADGPPIDCGANDDRTMF